MNNIFSRSPWERPSVVALRGSQLGQGNPYSWNNAGVMDPGGYYSWNRVGTGNPAQMLLRAAEESMNTPPPLNPAQRLLKQNAEQQAAAQCYTCVKDSDIRTGVDAATAATLRSEGFRCRKDECAQRGGYASGTYSGFNGYGNLMNFGSQQAASSMVSDIGPGPSGFGGGMMMGRRYPIVNQ